MVNGKVKAKTLMVSSFLAKWVIPKELGSSISEASKTKTCPTAHKEGQEGGLPQTGVCVTSGELHGGGKDDPPGRQGGVTGSSSWQD